MLAVVRGALIREAVTSVRSKRLARERALLRIALGELAKEHRPASAEHGMPARFTVQNEEEAGFVVRAPS